MDALATRDQVLAALQTVQDPELHQDLVSLEMIKEVLLSGAGVALTVELTTPSCPMKDVLQRDIEAALAALGIADVRITWSARVRQTVAPDPASQAEAVLTGVRNVVLVASGKGGVGKSTVAANLAVALARDGARVGLLDADIYGPSIPIMFGVRERPRSPDGKHIEPIRAHGITLMSIGFFVAPDQAMIWRGPVLNGTIVQFIRDVLWGELDYLIVDLPPGTGDVQLSISQQLKCTGALLVTTPQDVALADVTRGKAMFDQVHIPVLGIVENMSYFVCSSCSARHEIFAHGGGRAAADRLEVPYLGELPLLPSIREAGDFGMPVVIREPGSSAAEAFLGVARRLAGRISVQAVGTGAPRRKLFSRSFS